jgi:heme o synthase
MPVVRGFKNTKWQMFIYTVLLLFASLIPLAMGTVTAVYVIPTVLVGVVFCTLAVLCLRESDGSIVWAKRMFFFSLLYIPVWFLAIVVGTRGIV